MALNRSFQPKNLEEYAKKIAQKNIVSKQRQVNSADDYDYIAHQKRYLEMAPELAKRDLEMIDNIIVAIKKKKDE